MLATAYSITGRRAVVVTNRSSPARGARSSMNGGSMGITSNRVAPESRSACATSGSTAVSTWLPPACR